MCCYPALGTLAGHSTNPFLGPVTGGSKWPLWCRLCLSATFLPIKLLSNQALAGESLQNPSLSPLPTPAAQEESCLEGPHCNAKEVAMETQAGWHATQREKVPCVSCRAEEGAGGPCTEGAETGDGLCCGPSQLQLCQVRLAAPSTCSLAFQGPA